MQTLKKCYNEKHSGYRMGQFQWVYKKVQRSSVGHNLTPVGEVTWKHSNIVITLKWKKAIIMKQVTI